MKAKTLSVLMESSKSIHMWIKKGKESANVSVRFDKEEDIIRGYPENWILHNYPLNQYDSEGQLGKEVELDFLDGELPMFKQFIGPEDEKTILKAALTGVKRQAKDPMFKNDVTEKYRKECEEKIKKEIERLNKEEIESN